MILNAVFICTGLFEFKTYFLKWNRVGGDPYICRKIGAPILHPEDHNIDLFANIIGGYREVVGVILIGFYRVIFPGIAGK